MLSVAKYEDMKAHIKQHSSDCDGELDEIFNGGIFDRDAYLSLQNQLAVRELKAYKARETERGVQSISTEILNGLLSIHRESQNRGWSSYKAAKTFLEQNFKLPVSAFVRNPSVIVDVKLRDDICKCIAEDSVASLESSLLQECSGREYEDYLISRLTELKICFETESDLKLQGKPKTPDVLLLIPMATNSMMGASVVINWIDSKAMFAGASALLHTTP